MERKNKCGKIKPNFRCRCLVEFLWADKWVLVSFVFFNNGEMLKTNKYYFR